MAGKEESSKSHRECILEHGNYEEDVRASASALTFTLLSPAVPRTFTRCRGTASIVRKPHSETLVRKRIESLMSSDSQHIDDGTDNLLPVPPLLAERSNTAAILKVAWPSIIIGLLRTALGQVDAWYIGRMGTAQLEAISAASYAIWMIYLSGELPALSVQSLSAASEGAGERDSIGIAVIQGLWFSLGASVLIAIVALQPDLLRLYFSVVGIHDEEVVRAGIAYARATALWGTLPLAANNVASAAFKGIGETLPALRIAGATVLLNCFLNGPFIARWGVAGAAYATNLAVALSCVASLLTLSRRGVRLRVAPPIQKTITRIGRIGAPIASSGVLFTIVYMVLTRSLASLSPLYIAALGLGHRIEAIAFTVCEGFTIGSTAVVGQWAGSRRPASARKAAGAAARAASAFMVPIMILLWIGAAQAARCFSQDPLVIGATTSYLKIVSVMFPLMALDHVYEGALTGVQRTLPVFILSALFNLSRIPLARWLSGFWGVEGVWAAIAITSVLEAPAKWACFRLGSMDGVAVISSDTAK